MITELAATTAIAAGAYHLASSFSVLPGVHDLVSSDALFRLTGESIALTFDDGPHPEHTPQVLDFLEQTGHTATFFVVGEYAARYPAVLERMKVAGHTIGCHGWSHRRLPLLGNAALDEELTRCTAAIEDAVGLTPTLLRPPYGVRSLRLYRRARKRGLRLVMWSRDSRDWRNLGVEHVQGKLRNTRAGDIVLLHDALPSTPDMLVALKQFLQSSNLRSVALTASSS